MAINMLIGYKNPDGSVNSITARIDGGIDERKLFYKYYRTKERAHALIQNGSNESALGIYISEEEFNENSPLHNLEVTMLPLMIGNGEEDPMISFSDEDFNESQNKFNNTGRVYFDENVNKFFEDAKHSGFYDSDVYLFDSDTSEWTIGQMKQPLREGIIAHFDENADYNYDSSEEINDARKKLIDYMDQIDAFIKNRMNNSPNFVDSSSGELTTVEDLKFLQMYNELALYAQTIGINIDQINVSFTQKHDLTDDTAIRR